MSNHQFLTSMKLNTHAEQCYSQNKGHLLIKEADKVISVGFRRLIDSLNTLDGTGLIDPNGIGYLVACGNRTLLFRTTDVEKLAEMIVSIKESNVIKTDHTIHKLIASRIGDLLYYLQEINSRIDSSNIKYKSAYPRIPDITKEGGVEGLRETINLMNYYTRDKFNMTHASRCVRDFRKKVLSITNLSDDHIRHALDLHSVKQVMEEK